MRSIGSAAAERGKGRRRGLVRAAVAVAVAVAGAMALSATGGAAPSPAADGGFHVVNGAVVDPAGGRFVAKGLAIGDVGVQDDLLRLFPGVNIVRVTFGTDVSPSAYASFVDAMTARKNVVLLEHHPWPLADAYTGSQLQAESADYAKLAGAFKDDPYVWFGSMNEPQGGDITAQQVATYDAVRNAGAGNIVVMESGVGSGNPGQTGPAVLDASAYARMTNIVWDLHAYGWITGGNPDQDAVNQKLVGSADSGTGVLAAQAIRSADGTVPVIVCEFGVSTSGTARDGNADSIVEGVTRYLVTNSYTSGFIAWHWDADPYNQLVRDGARTSWGDQLAAAIQATPDPGSTPSPDRTVVTAGSDQTITDNAGHRWGIDAGNQVTVDGAIDATTANVTELAWVGGQVWQQNTAGLWWAKTVPTDTWSPTYGTPTSPLDGS